MSLFLWKPSYEIGILEIDMQHRQLVGMINELFDSLNGGQTGAAVDHVLNELADYVKHHFSTEERYMREYDYPGYAEHHQRHVELTRHVLAYHDRRSQGETVNILDLMNFLRDWLVQHITRQDMDFGSFLKKQRRLSTPRGEQAGPADRATRGIMHRAQPGDRVTLHYIGTLDNGRIFDQRDAESPLQVVLGEGEVFPDLEAEIIGMTVGEVKNIHLPAERAYGLRKEDNLLRLRRELFPPNRELQVGEKLSLEFGDSSQRLMRIRKVGDEEVVLDGNHDLAGCDLTFALELVDISRP